MADKSVGELIAAQYVTPTDLFVLEQNGTAKKLTGQILENWLVSFADGHGGIQSIVKKSTSGLADTYRITLADTTFYDFVVTNGRSVNSITKTSASGLVDTYTISYNNGTTSTFTVTNGEKGDKGDTAYIWIKYASQEPTVNSNSFGDVPDDWIGVYFGFSSTAPTDWSQYKWYRIKGEKGDTGEPATLVSSSVTYQVSDSGTIIPSGSWSASIPTVAQGKYLWTREVTKFNTGNPITKYSVSRMGIDGTGAVVTVCNVSPDSAGNVDLDASSVGALSTKGGIMEGDINMNGQKMNGLNMPTENTEPATKKYVDDIKTGAVQKTGDAMTGPLSVPAPTENAHAVNKEYADTKAVTATLPVSGWVASETSGFIQTITVPGLTDLKKAEVYPAQPDTLAEKLAMAEETAKVRGCSRSGNQVTFECWEEKPTLDIPVIVEVYV